MVHQLMKTKNPKIAHNLPFVNQKPVLESIFTSAVTAPPAPSARHVTDSSLQACSLGTKA